MNTDQSTTNQTLANRITSVLLAAGFTNRVGAENRRGPAFIVTPGVGATVSVMWWDVPDDERTGVLIKYADALRDDGLTVSNRDNHLYVGEEPEPPAAIWVRQAQHRLAYIQKDCAFADVTEQLLILSADLCRAAEVLADPMADERSNGGRG